MLHKASLRKLAGEFRDLARKSNSPTVALSAPRHSELSREDQGPTHKGRRADSSRLSWPQVNEARPPRAGSPRLPRESLRCIERIPWPGQK